MDVNASSLAMILVGTAVVAKVLWELYLSPLARGHVPGPKWAAVSDASHYWLQLQRRRSAAYHDLFERYGPVVRIGPNRVIFRSANAAKTIYSSHNFRKSSWYDVFTFGGAKNIFSTQDPVYHARSRRLCVPAFRGENLRAAGPALLQEMDDLVGRLRHDCGEGGFVDVNELFPKLTLDILGLAVLGVRFNQIATGQVSEFQKNLDYWFIDKLLIQPLPFVRSLPISRLQKFVASDSAITKYVMDLYDNIDEKSADSGWSMIESYKTYRDPETGDPAPRPLVASDLSQMFIAGTETAAIALVYASHLLSSREEIWKIMRTELSTVSLDAGDLVETLRGLPYLNAFLREILRVHGPAPVFFERLVPAGGATLDGYSLPAGTAVGAQAYSSHFDEQVFPQPHMVDPLRWVRLDDVTGKYVSREDITPDMNSHYFPFGVGVRMCVGKALADLELALITAVLVKNFRIHPHETVTPAAMSPVELLTMRPRATQCWFRFEYAPTEAA